MEPNCHFVCEICEREATCPYTITIRCGRGREYDMPALTLDVCKECADRLYTVLSRPKGAVNKKPWWDHWRNDAATVSDRKEGGFV